MSVSFHFVFLCHNLNLRQRRFRVYSALGDEIYVQSTRKRSKGILNDVFDTNKSRNPLNVYSRPGKSTLRKYGRIFGVLTSNTKYHRAYGKDKDFIQLEIDTVQPQVECVEEYREGSTLDNHIEAKVEDKSMQDWGRVGRPVGRAAWNKGAHTPEHVRIKMRDKAKATWDNPAVAEKRKAGCFRAGRRAWNKGRSCSDETRRRIRVARTGSRHSAATRQRISEALTGRSLPEEVKAKMSLVHKGKAKGAEQRARIAQSMKRVWAKKRAAKKLEEKENRTKSDAKIPEVDNQKTSPDLSTDERPMTASIDKSNQSAFADNSSSSDQLQTSKQPKTQQFDLGDVHTPRYTSIVSQTDKRLHGRYELRYQSVDRLRDDYSETSSSIDEDVEMNDILRKNMHALLQANRTLTQPDASHSEANQISNQETERTINAQDEFGRNDGTDYTTTTNQELGDDCFGERNRNDEIPEEVVEENILSAGSRTRVDANACLDRSNELQEMESSSKLGHRQEVMHDQQATAYNRVEGDSTEQSCNISQNQNDAKLRSMDKERHSRADKMEDEQAVANGTKATQVGSISISVEENTKSTTKSMTGEKNTSRRPGRLSVVKAKIEQAPKRDRSKGIPIPIDEPPPPVTKARLGEFYRSSKRWVSLSEDLQPWVDSFVKKTGRRPNMQDVRATRIPWLNQQFVMHHKLRNKLVSEAPAIRSYLEYLQRQQKSGDSGSKPRRKSEEVESAILETAKRLSS